MDKLKEEFEKLPPWARWGAILAIVAIAFVLYLRSRTSTTTVPVGGTVPADTNAVGDSTTTPNNTSTPSTPATPPTETLFDTIFGSVSQSQLTQLNAAYMPGGSIPYPDGGYNKAFDLAWLNTVWNPQHGVLSQYNENPSAFGVTQTDYQNALTQVQRGILPAGTQMAKVGGGQASTNVVAS